jgi:hypothetical protein
LDNVAPVFISYAEIAQLLCGFDLKNEVGRKMTDSVKFNLKRIYPSKVDA